MSLTSDALQREVSRQFGALASMLAQLAGPYVASLPPGGPTAAALAEDLLGFTEGAVVLSRAHRDPKRIRAALKRYAAALRLQQRR
jgi:hypothetical protein